ncbi:MAG: AIM24 family protein [Patescibacteria group bacterium]
MIKYEVTSQEEFIVDNSHIVAFEDTLNYTIDKAGK